MRGKRNAGRGARTALSRMMLVVLSDSMRFAMPKSMSFRSFLTMRKLAGFRSPCTTRSSCTTFAPTPSPTHDAQAREGFCLVAPLGLGE